MTTETLTLTDFLLARIAEDEAVALAETAADRAHADRMRELPWPAKAARPKPSIPDVGHSPRTVRVLAECEAKRRIVGIHADYGGYGNVCQTCQDGDIDLKPWPCPTLRALALPYAEHADYRPEWAP